MSKGLVRLGHLVHVFPPLDRGAEAVAGIEDLICEAQRHRLFAPLTAVTHQPTDREGGGSARTHLDRHLVRGTADTTALDLELGLHVLDSALEGGKRLAAGLLLD